MKRVSGDIEAWKPGIVGFSMQDGGSSYLPLAMGTMLRLRGYEGHITCGGQFATLAREWLLERYGWIDSVVRFAGEVPIVDLARKIRDGAGCSGVPGLTTRAGDGVPAPVLDSAPMRTWPERGELPGVVGYPMANIAASRGCQGRCAYCGPAALQDLEVREGLAGGLSRRDLACIGVGGARRRDLDDLCDEMACLWHERGVRYFKLVDEHPLPLNEEGALEYIGRWKRGLGKRGVGALGIGMEMRADKITPRIANELVEMGLIEAFVGLELVGREESLRFGRPCMAGHAAEMVGLFGSMGVATASHVMLVHPYSTPASIRAGMDFLASLQRGIFEVNRMQVYHGTRLHWLMSEEGRLVGNPLRYDYTFEDPRVKRFDDILTRLRMEAFGNHSVAYSAHDAWLALALRRRLEGTGLLPVSERFERICRRIRSLQARTLHEAFDLAMHETRFNGFSDLVRRTREGAACIREEIEDISILISRPGSSRPIFSHMRAAAATALGVLMIGAPLASCYSSQRGSFDGAAEDVGQVEVVEEESEAPRECTTEEIYDLRDRVREAARDADPCFSGYVVLRSGEVFVHASAWNAPQYCSTPENIALLEERESMVKSAVESLDLDLECEVAHTPYLDIEVMGQDVEDERRLHQAVHESCPDIPEVCGGDLIGTVIKIDSEGRVMDVRVQEGCDLPPEVIECIRSALEGLTFPCLAGYELCPEQIALD